MNKPLKEFIFERLKLNKDTNILKFDYLPKTRSQLISTINEKIRKLKKGETILNLNDIDTSEITDMSQLFVEVDFNYNQIHKIILDKWIVNNVTNMTSMFLGKSDLEEIDITNWKTSKLTSTKYMFCNCQVLKNIGQLDNWNVSNINNFYGMFANCKQLHVIGDISNWQVSQTADFSGMFKGCKGLYNIGDLNNWHLNNIDPSNINNMFKNVSTKVKIPNWYK